MKRKVIAVLLAAALALSGSMLALAAEEDGAPAESGTENGDVETPDVEMSDVETPDVETPDVETPDVETGSGGEEKNGEAILADEPKEEMQDGERTVYRGSGDGWEWVLTDDGVMTCSGTGVVERIDSDFPRHEVTSVIIEEGITGIGVEAFDWYQSLTEITIPGSVTEIGRYAFYGCTSLASLILPSSVTKIGKYAFYGCTSLKAADIPDSVKEMGAFAFAYCENLTEISLPKGIAILEESVFRGCKNLKGISLPNSVTGIAYKAFANCTSLPEVTIPRSVKRIGHGAFAECKGLKSVTFEGNAPEINSGNVKGGSLEPFYNVTATASYPKGDATWDAMTRRAYGKKLNWMVVTDKTKGLRIVPEVTDNFYIIGSARGATIECTGELKDFVSVYMDDAEVDRSNYTLQEGSTILTFTTKYLDTLSVGRHKVTLNYTYGSVDTELDILEKSDGLGGTGTQGTAAGNSGTGSPAGRTAAPRTGDSAAVLPWLFAAGVCIMVLRRKKHIA